ncbi:MAG: ATP-binding cassette domain-containing protein [Acidimicrobiales bacterium]
MAGPAVFTPETAKETLDSGPAGTPALEVEGLHKSFGAVSALSDGNLSVQPGEVLGLLGDNGAGKSTLVKCVTGRVHADGGRIRVSGQVVAFQSPAEARALGIEAVHQNLALVDSLDVATNLFLGRELAAGPRWLRWLGVLRQRAMLESAREVLSEIGVAPLSLTAPVESLSGGQRQGIAVARAVAWGQKVVLMDEPAAALGVEQARHVLDLVRTLARKEVAVVFISHNMEHVMQVCDRVTVLRHGRTVGSANVADVSAVDLVGFITGALAMSDPSSRSSACGIPAPRLPLAGA